MLDGAQAEPETPPTPGAPTGAGSPGGIQRAGRRGGRARFGVCQRFTERCRPPGPRGLCPGSAGRAGGRGRSAHPAPAA